MSIAVVNSARISVLERLVERREYRKALAYGIRLSQTPGFYSEYERLLLDLIRAESLAFLGQCREAEVICRAAVPELRHSSLHALFARCCFVLSVAFERLGDFEQAIENANLAHYTFRRIEDHARAVRTLNWHASIYFFKGDYQNALRIWQECELHSKRHGLAKWCSAARGNAAKIFMLLGEPEIAHEKIAGNRAVLVARNEPLNVFRHDLSVAFLCVLQRRFGRAEKCLKSYTPARQSTYPARERGIWHEYFGELELSRGRLPDAATHLEQAITIGEGAGPDLSLIGQSRRLLAQVRLAENRLDDARTECELAYAAVREVGERIEEGILDRVMGEIHQRRGHEADARTCYESSIKMLRMIGAKLELGRTLLVAGQSPAFVKQEQLAHLLEADRLFAEVGVSYWIDLVQSELDKSRIGVGAEVRKTRPEDQPVTFVSVNPEMREMLQMADAWASSDMAVLVTGETGTGKDLLARIIHNTSPRRDEPFVDIDPSTLSESLWESELFGHKKGTFTGASSEKVGLLESANGGTVFFNEIGNLSPPLQAKLLEFLDSHEIRRVGSTIRRPLNVRLIAATNSELANAVDSGAFRADLFHRLNGAHVHISPLRDRAEDIPFLIRHFLTLYGSCESSLDCIDSVPWLEKACQQVWLGNVRQLSAFVHRLVTLGGRDDVAGWNKWADTLLDQLERHDRRVRTEDERRRLRIVRTLEANTWNQRAAARDLDMNESSLRRAMQRYGIKRP